MYLFLFSLHASHDAYAFSAESLSIQLAIHNNVFLLHMTSLTQSVPEDTLKQFAPNRSWSIFLRNNSKTRCTVGNKICKPCWCCCLCRHSPTVLCKYLSYAACRLTCCRVNMALLHMLLMFLLFSVVPLTHFWLHNCSSFSPTVRPLWSPSISTLSNRFGSIILHIARRLGQLSTCCGTWMTIEFTYAALEYVIVITQVGEMFWLSPKVWSINQYTPTSSQLYYCLTN